MIIALMHFPRRMQFRNEATMLAYSKEPAPLTIVIEASEIAVGTVLQQEVDGHYQSLEFLLCKRSTTEGRYSTLGRELLAVYLAVQHFRHFVERQQFYILTGHTPLVHAFCSLRPDGGWQSSYICVAKNGAHNRIHFGYSFYTRQGQCRY